MTEGEGGAEKTEKARDVIYGRPPKEDVLCVMANVASPYHLLAWRRISKFKNHMACVIIGTCEYKKLSYKGEENIVKIFHV